tara:strand:+ start:129736 stop:130548 length:813 start_codon:yes stop_codon:yes gene_type:complete
MPGIGMGKMRNVFLVGRYYMLLGLLMFLGRLDADQVLSKEIWVGWIEREEPSLRMGSSPYGIWNAAGGNGQTVQQSDPKSKRKARVFRWGVSDIPSHDSSAKKKMERKYKEELKRQRRNSKEDRLKKRRVDWRGKSETTTKKESLIRSETRSRQDPELTTPGKPRMFRWDKGDAKYSRQPSSPTKNGTKVRRGIRDQNQQFNPLSKSKKNQDKSFSRAQDSIRGKVENEKINKPRIPRWSREAPGYSRPKVRNRNEGREKPRMLRREARR